MIDTATKRYTISNLSSPWRMLGPVPDGTITAADRVAYLYLYAMAPAETTPAGFIRVTTATIATPTATAYIQPIESTATILN